MEVNMARVLIVDDSRTSRKFLRDILEHSGNEVAGEAVNGKEGFEMYQKLKPDIVTMDITMPEMDGIESLKLIMRYDPSARIIMVTAAGQQQKMVEAVKYGALEFMSKPFDTIKIVETIQKVMQPK